MAESAGEIGFDIPEFSVEIPKNRECGDYASNIAMVLVCQTTKNTPMEIAEELVSKIKYGSISDTFKKIEIVSPGFINFFLSKDYLKEEIRNVLKEKESYGSSDKGKGKTMLIDYSGVNIAKPFGIGHLRSTIIGQAIYNLHKFLGYNVIGDNHIGDWGTQFGKLIYAIKNWGYKKKVSEYSVKSLVELYVKFHEEAEEDPDLEREARNWFKKLEEGDAEARKIWKECVKISLKEFDRIYKFLGVKIDLTLGESFYEKMLPGVIEEAIKKGIAANSEGAVIIPFPDDVLPPLLIQKSDGATLYSTRDLATIKYRIKRFKPSKIIYEVGAEQSLYFKQLFWASELFGWGKREDYVHVAHGLMRLKTGKMSTRRGEIIFLEDVLAEATKKAEKIIEEKNPNLKDVEKTAKAIGIGAVKYNGLSGHPTGDIVFDWSKALNLQGNSGPYLQYAYARARNILKKDRRRADVGKKNFENEMEIRLAKKIQEFPFVVEKAAYSYSPNLICSYLFELSKEFNSFYESVPVLKSEGDIAGLRLALIKATSQVIKNGLGLLGISVLENM